MNAPSKIDMLAAARLTREGRLEDAMAVLRKSFSVGPATENAVAFKSDVEPTPGIAPLSRLSIGKALGGLAQRFGRLRPAQDLSAPGFGKKLDLPLGELLAPATGRTKPRPPDGARFEHRHYSNAAGARNYKLYIPSGYSGQALPLVVMMHGCTQSPDDFAAGTRMNALAEEQTFFVAYPAQRRSANAGKCWNWFKADEQQRDRGEPSLIAGITRAIMQEFSVDPGRVYIAGLSAGGAAAAIMGSVYPDIYAAVGVHSGLPHGAARDMPSAFKAMKQGGTAASGSRPGQNSGGGVPTIVFHGDGDTTVHPSNGRDVIAQAKAWTDHVVTVIGGTSEGRREFTRTVHADASGRPMAEHWELHGAGHAWSGGSAAGSFTDPRGPDASREMLRFFSQHKTR